MTPGDWLRASRNAREHRSMLFGLFYHWCFGLVAALVMTIAILLTDTAHIGSLVLGGGGVLPVALLFAGLAITLSSVSMGYYIMAMRRDD